MSEPHGESKAVKREAELRLEIQSLQTQLSELKEPPSDALFTDPASLVSFERQVKSLTDQIQSLSCALRLQQTLMSSAMHERERKILAGDTRWTNYGYRPQTIQTLGGLDVVVYARYWATHANLARKGKGASVAMLLLGFCEGCTPALASEVAQLAAALNSFDDAQARLLAMGVTMSIKKISQIAYAFSERARAQQQISGFGIPGTLKGRRVVISTDGGRLRIRSNKRGKKTAKGRSRYHTHWREPKLLVIYVVDENGKMSSEFTPVLDGTLKGPDAVFALIASYLKELEITSADRVLFIADGAKWIWCRVVKLWSKLGLRADQIRELVDFYHVMEHVSSLAKMKRWKPSARTAWVNRQRQRLLKGEVAAFVSEIEQVTTGNSAGLRRERHYLLRNAKLGRLNYASVKAEQLPIGSGTIESTVRRVVNLRLKGASLFWREPHAEAMLLLRAYYKARHWKVLEMKAFSPLTNLAA